MLRFSDLQVLTSKEICKSRNLKISHISDFGMLRFGDLQVLTSKEICKSRNLKITKYITR